MKSFRLVGPHVSLKGPSRTGHRAVGAELAAVTGQHDSLCPPRRGSGEATDFTRAWCQQEKAAARVAMDIRRHDQMLLFLALQHQFIGGILGTRRKGRKAPETGFCPGQTVLGSEWIHPPSGGGGEGQERDGAGWLIGPAVDRAGAGCGEDVPSWFRSLARGGQMTLSVGSFLGRDEATRADFGVLAQPLAWALVCSSPTELGRWFGSCRGSPRNETQQREVDWKRGVGVPLASSPPQTSRAGCRAHRTAGTRNPCAAAPASLGVT